MQVPYGNFYPEIQAFLPTGVGRNGARTNLLTGKPSLDYHMWVSEMPKEAGGTFPETIL